MPRRGTIAALILVTCLSAAPYAHSDANEPIPDVCENIQNWLVKGSSLDLIVILCSITEGDSPVQVEHGDDSNPEYESEINQSDVPEDVKTTLLLLLSFWDR